jgi:FtsP/CotA-like multicopper oxidase with cupredoxin domain
MDRTVMKPVARAIALAVMLPLLCAVGAQAAIDGIPVTAATVDLTATVGHVTTADGPNVRYLMWGYAEGSGDFQYPGPTLIVEHNTTVTIELTNELDVNTSIIFPGQTGVTTSGGVPGVMTQEAEPSGTVTYSFVTDKPGTYIYHSGTNPELQVEMGLVGVIIVRPPGFSSSSPTAYDHPDTAYDREYLFLLTEMDAVMHDAIEFNGGLGVLGGMDFFSGAFPVYWMINGRTGPDTLLSSDEPLLASQPYNALVRMKPGERVLMRVVGGGKQLHPFHHHGNHARIIGRNGRLVESTAGAGPDLAQDVFTISSIPGETVDAIFTWTGEGLGWDIYGTGAGFAHACTSAGCTDVSPIDGFDDGTGDPCFDDTTNEYCPDHGKAFPVTLPDVNETDLGAFWSGSPFMGTMGFLPPDFTSFNPNAGFVYMWHSHTEKELTNFDIFPGGMMTMCIVEPPGTVIP